MEMQMIQKHLIEIPLAILRYYLLLYEFEEQYKLLKIVIFVT